MTSGGVARAVVDECRRGAKHGSQEQSDRDRDVEPGEFLGEQDSGRPYRMQQQEQAGRQERERQQQHPSVPAAVGGVSGGVREHRRQAAHDHEQHEVQPWVGEVRVQVRAE